MDQSDFLTHFLDIAGEELLKSPKQVSIEKVQSMLELTLRNPSSVSLSDKYKDDLVIEMSSMTLAEQILKITSVVGADSTGKSDLRAMLDHKVDMSGLMSMGGLAGSNLPFSGIDALLLNFSVSFPISLILNKKMMTKYQLLFRNLMQCKYAERLLSASWLDETRARLSITRGRGSDQAFVQEECLFMSRLSSLRGKMQHFIQEFLYYVCFEVIEPNCERLLKRFDKRSTVDEVLKDHEDFLDSCLKESLLTTPKLFQVYILFLFQKFRFSMV